MSYLVLDVAGAEKFRQLCQLCWLSWVVREQTGSRRRRTIQKVSNSILASSLSNGMVNNKFLASNNFLYEDHYSWQLEPLWMRVLSTRKAQQLTLCSILLVMYGACTMRQVSLVRFLKQSCLMPHKRIQCHAKYFHHITLQQTLCREYVSYALSSCIYAVH